MISSSNYERKHTILNNTAISGHKKYISQPKIYKISLHRKTNWKLGNKMRGKFCENMDK